VIELRSNSKQPAGPTFGLGDETLLSGAVDSASKRGGGKRGLSQMAQHSQRSGKEMACTDTQGHVRKKKRRSKTGRHMPSRVTKTEGFKKPWIKETSRRGGFIQKKKTSRPYEDLRKRRRLHEPDTRSGKNRRYIRKPKLRKKQRSKNGTKALNPREGKERPQRNAAKLLPNG